MEASMLRQRARENLADNWGVSIGVAAVASLLGGLLVGVSFLPEISTSIEIPLLREFSLWLEEGLRLGDVTVNFKTGVFGFAAFLLGGVLQLGYARFLLKQHDRQNPEFNDLFSEFDRFGTGFAQHFLCNLYTALWTILLIIPGIIASYSYAMTPFILAEHPELTASQAITRSKEMMDGHKADLFILDMTYLGWGILAALTLNIGNLWLNPYRNAAYATFYRQLQASNMYT